MCARALAWSELRLLSAAAGRMLVEVRGNSLRGSSVKIGTMQRRLARPLRKDDTRKSRSVNNCMFVEVGGPTSRLPDQGSEPSAPCADHSPLRSGGWTLPGRIWTAGVMWGRQYMLAIPSHIYIYIYIYIYAYIYIYIPTELVPRQLVRALML